MSTAAAMTETAEAAILQQEPQQHQESESEPQQNHQVPESEPQQQAEPEQQQEPDDTSNKSNILPLFS